MNVCGPDSYCKERCHSNHQRDGRTCDKCREDDCKEPNDRQFEQELLLRMDVRD